MRAHKLKFCLRYQMFTPLLAAASNGRTEVIRCLLGAGANIHAVTAHGNTCLHLACLNGHSSLVQVLLDWSPMLISVVNGKGQVCTVK